MLKRNVFVFNWLQDVMQFAEEREPTIQNEGIVELLEQPIGNIACGIPDATHIFHRHKLDFCCDGGQSLGEAAARRGVDTTLLTNELDRLSDQPFVGRDWRDASAEELIEYILRHFHDRHREQLPELLRLARRVEAVQGDKADCPIGLADHLAFMEQDLETL